MVRLIYQFVMTAGALIAILVLAALFIPEPEIDPNKEHVPLDPYIRAVGVNKDTACKYETLHWDDARRADGSSALREEQRTRRSDEFFKETGKDWSQFWDKWTVYLVKNGNPC